MLGESLSVREMPIVYPLCCENDVVVRGSDVWHTLSLRAATGYCRLFLAAHEA